MGLALDLQKWWFKRISDTKYWVFSQIIFSIYSKCQYFFFSPLLTNSIYKESVNVNPSKMLCFALLVDGLFQGSILKLMSLIPLEHSSIVLAIHTIIAVHKWGNFYAASIKGMHFHAFTVMLIAKLCRVLNAKFCYLYMRKLCLISFRNKCKKSSTISKTVRGILFLCNFGATKLVLI